MNKQIERFWKQEELPEIPQYTEKEKYCELYFANTVKRDVDGRFIVRLPKRSDIILGDSKEQALRWFFSIKRKFSKDSEQNYVQFMENYIKQNHMFLLKDKEP